MFGFKEILVTMTFEQYLAKCTGVWVWLIAEPQGIGFDILIHLQVFKYGV
jgi:hypothetical protein